MRRPIRGAWKRRCGPSNRLMSTWWGRCWRACGGFPGSRLLIVSDHYTKLSTRTHAREPVPFALWGKGPDKAEAWDEENAAASGRFVEEGWRLADMLFE